MILEQLLDNLINNLYLSYFFLIIFGMEFIKMFSLYNPSRKFYVFIFDKKKIFKWRARWMTIFLSTFLIPFFYYFDKENFVLYKLILTYTVATSFYEIFLEGLINKLKEFLFNFNKLKINSIKRMKKNKNLEDRFYYYNEIFEK